MGLANSNVKISKKDDFVCLKDSTKYLVKLVVQATNIFWTVDINRDISSDPGTISTVD